MAGEQKNERAVVASGVYTVSDADKAVVKDNILEALVRSKGKALTGILRRVLGPHRAGRLSPRLA